ALPTESAGTGTRTGSARCRSTAARAHPTFVSSGTVRFADSAGRFAERVVEGRDDAGADERIVIWIERQPGAIWAVGRAVNPHLRDSALSRADDYVWQGYELEDALAVANATLEDDCFVSEADGFAGIVRPFRRAELLEPLERLFFGRPPVPPATSDSHRGSGPHA